jgi:hypothetical protein
VSPFGRCLEPREPLRETDLTLAAEKVQRSEVGLRLGQPHSGGGTQPAHALALVALRADSHQQHQAQVVLRVRVALISGPLEPLRGLGVALPDAKSGSVKQAEGKLRSGMARARVFRELAHSLAEIAPSPGSFAVLVASVANKGREKQQTCEDGEA